MKYQQVLCIVAGLLPLAAITGLSFVVPGFSLSSSYISDLGVSPFGMFFNVSLILAALLAVPFVLQVYKRYNYLIILFMVAAALLVGVGVFPATSELHKPFAALFFLFALVSILIAGSKMQRKWSRWISFAAGILGIACLALFSPLTETVMIFVIGLWVAGVGVFYREIYKS